MLYSPSLFVPVGLVGDIMLKYPCLVLDHDDTVVQSEKTIGYPFFCTILEEYRPGQRITLEQYVKDCHNYGFAEMCRMRWQFTDEELYDEYIRWMAYVREHIPDAFPGIGRVINRQQELGGKVIVVSHSCNQNITRDYAAHFGIQPDDIFGWDYPEHLRKPNPYPLEQIMAKYDLKPQDLLVVDDMKPAWEMASKVGAPIAFAAWGRQDYPEIMAEMTKLCNFTFHKTKDLEHFLFEET